VVFLQFNHHHHDGFAADVDVGVHCARCVYREPVGFARLPYVMFGGAVLLDDVDGPSLDRDDDASMVVMVRGSRRPGSDDRLPDFDVVVLKLWEALGHGLLGCQNSEGSDRQNDCKSEAPRTQGHEKALLEI
jgi:hypothetical protein